MGLLDSLVANAVSSALGVNSEGMAGNVVKGVVGMLTGGSGSGLTDLVGKLTQSGLGDVVSSWIGKGANKAISPTQLVEALGQDQVNAMAREAGIPEEKGAEVLSKVLPEVVNEVTPDGEIPDNDKMSTLTKVILGGLGVAGATMAAKAVAGRFGNNDAEEDESELVTADAGVAAAPQPAPAAAQPQAQTYTVVSGDNLSKIAKHFYGNANDWQRIFDANRDQISNPDMIHPGQVLRIP